ncbi:thioredoxin family protein [Candidatus Woesearchaeota archaeon]|nr:thioredoxin family protein [Candidatus Woesearchaeota archaeon]
MKTIICLVFVLAFSAALLGCTQAEISMEKEDAMAEKDSSIMEKEAMMEKNASAMAKEETMMEKSPYAGKVLAGTGSTKYLDFSKADYDKALQEKKKILLYFYANWCPICKKEQADTFAAFNELNDPGLVGFRVNYRDGDDDESEKALAKEFGVGYQHTKVILKDGQRILKAPDSWDKARYLEELGKI